jgi:hypothetical protein
MAAADQCPRSFFFFGVVFLISKERNSQYRHNMVYSLLENLQSALFYKIFDIWVSSKWGKQSVIRNEIKDSRY